MDLHVCARVFVCVKECECVCAHACMSVFMHASNTLHLAYVHSVCVCVCLTTHICVCVLSASVWVYVWCHLFVSGSGHIHVFISVPSGQMRLSCLLKWDTIPNTRPKTTACFCSSVQSHNQQLWFKTENLSYLHLVLIMCS